MREVTVPEPIEAVYIPTGKRMQIPDEDAPEDKKVYTDKGQQIAPLRDDDPWTLHRFLAAFVTVDDKWFDAKRGNRYKAWKHATEILEAFENAAVGAKVRISDDAWERARDVIESWTFEDPEEAEKKKRRPRAWNDYLMPQLVPLMSAILDAPKVEA